MVRHDGEELKVCGLSGGGNRIRTIGPAPAKALFWALPIGDGGTKRRSHLQVQVRDGDACLEWLRIGFPFAVGPRVRIRLPPAVSLRTIGSAVGSPVLACGQNRRTRSPAIACAIETPHSGRPRRKLLVPSIGSTIQHRSPASPPRQSTGRIAPYESSGG